MANVDRPRGAIAVGTLSGQSVGGHIRQYPVDASNATAIFRGDFVTAEADGNVGVATVGTGNVILGVCVGVVVDRAVAGTEHPGYLPASTAGTILVAVGPDILYEVQEDSAVSNLALADVGTNVAFVAGAGSATTGVSGHELDSDSKVATTEQLRIVGFVAREDNEIGTNGKWLVRINESFYGTAAGV